MKLHLWSLITASFLFLNSSSLLAADITEADSSNEDSFFSALAQELKYDLTTDPSQEVLTGLNPKVPSQACDLRRFEESVLNSPISTADYFKSVKNYFARCADELSQGSAKGLTGLIRFARYKYPFLSHPQIQRMSIPLSNGRVVQGILALRPDASARPFVIYRCGVLCGAGESASMRAYLMYLFDQGPFNVLLLGNQTGLDYIMDNRLVSMAGWSEGHENMEIGKWLLQKWQYKERISSLHFMAVSLGGNGASFAAVYNDQELLDNGQRVFSSIAAICPVINLRPSLEKLFNAPAVGPIFFKMTRDHYQKGGKYVTDVPDLLTSAQLPRLPQDMPDFVGLVASTALSRRGIASTSESFFAMNNFWNLNANVKTPLLVWASKDDMIVNNDVNTQVMEDDPGIQASPMIGVVNLRYGNHCGFSSVYGAQTTATILRSFVLAHSPEFIDQYLQKKELAWSFGKIPAMSHYEHLAQSWKFSSQSSKVKVVFKLLNRDTAGCDLETRNLPLYCVSEKSFSVPIEELREMSARIPQNETEAQALTREFNTKVEFRTFESALSGTHSKDFKMVWSAGY